MITKTTTEALDTFVENFKKKCVRNKDYLTYGFESTYHAAASCAEANFIIQRLDLPLSAIHTRSCDYFVVQGLNSDL